MSRLTFCCGDNDLYFVKKGHCSKFFLYYYGEAIEKLAEYENTGLSPEAIYDMSYFMGLFPLCLGCDGKKNGMRTELCEYNDGQMKCAKRALAFAKDLLDYRALGSVEELTKLKEKYDAKIN